MACNVSFVNEKADGVGYSGARDDVKPLLCWLGVLPLLPVPELCGLLYSLSQFLSVLCCFPAGVQILAPILNLGVTFFEVGGLKFLCSFGAIYLFISVF